MLRQVQVFHGGQRLRRLHEKKGQGVLTHTDIRQEEAPPEYKMRGASFFVYRCP
jgi:hypothetical protein